MTGPPNPRLFAARAEVHWFMAMARIERAKPGRMVKLCATDPYIERDLHPRIRATDEAAALKSEAERICFSAASGGWEKFHHHHHHLRLERLANGDEMAAYIEEAHIRPLLAGVPALQLLGPEGESAEADTPCCDEELPDPYADDGDE